MKRNRQEIDFDQCKRHKKDELHEKIANNCIKLDPLSRLKSDFFDKSCVDLCKHLIGKYMIRKYEDGASASKYTVGRIVEVEAYTGKDDPASHSFKKQTDRNKAMFMKPGTAYVYNIYGCYCCINISSKEPGAAVLIRALEPVYGLDLMTQNKNSLSKGKSKNSNEKNLTNGPSKLCMSFKISKSLFNQVDLATSENIWFQDKINDDGESVGKSEFKIQCAKRIGIDYAGPEAANKLWRFYIKDNKYVSIVSKDSTDGDN